MLESLRQISPSAFVEASALESNFVHAEQAHFTRHHRCGERKHVLRDHAIATDDAMFPHAAKLVYARKRADISVVLYFNMSRQRSRVPENRMASNAAIVRDMGIGHDPVV